MNDFARARKIMVDTQLRTSSITDRRLLSAMGEVPRERFVPEDRRALAYIDAEIPIAPGRLLSAPAAFGRLVQLANIASEDTVLDLGSGTGYSTAILAALARHVTGVEPDSGLAEAAASNLLALDVANASVRVGSLDAAGLADGPFDVIVVESVIEEVPQALLARLKDQGRLVAVLGRGMTGVAHLYVKAGQQVAGRADFNLRLPAVGRPEHADDFVF
jgi:protein-L-isoaspartate(D-aspartate) O-methyltransferase